MIRSIMIGLLFLTVATAFAQNTQPIQPSNNLHPAISPDGVRIVFESDRDGNSEVYIMSVDGSDVRRLTDHPAQDGLPTWSRDGKRILFTSDRDTRRHPRPYYSIKPDGSDLEKVGQYDDVFRAWSPNGLQMLTFERTDGNTDIYIQNVDGLSKERLTTDPAFDSDMTFSPDGTKIVYESFVGDLSTAGVYVMNVDGSRKVRLTDGTNPKWSPDGTQILYKARNAKGKCCDVFVMQADGSKQTRLAKMAYFQQWLPDGDRLIYFSSISGTYQIYSMNADGSDKRPLTY